MDSFNPRMPWLPNHWQCIGGALVGLVAPQFYVNLFNAFFGAFSVVLAAYFFVPHTLAESKYTRLLPYSYSP